VTLICPEPPIIDPYIDKIKIKVEMAMSTARLAVVNREPKIF